VDCLFCRIAEKKIPARIAYADPELIAFHDVSPQAPVHVLIIPRRHIETTNDLKEADDGLVGRIQRLAARLAAELKIAQEGYRTVYNCNRGAGQSVFHIHLHLLGGRPLGWPPG
jgi:histidine triad (HIT) family protein